MKHYTRSEDVLDFYGHLISAFVVVGVVFLVAGYVRADSVLCGDSVFFGSGVFPCGAVVTTSSTATTTSTTSTVNRVLPPSVYEAKGSRLRNMSYDYTEPPREAGGNTLGDLFGWLFNIF